MLTCLWFCVVARVMDQQRQVISQIKAKNPQVPIIIYINKVSRRTVYSTKHLSIPFDAARCHVTSSSTRVATPFVYSALHSDLPPLTLPPLASCVLPSQSGALLERMSQVGVDMVSLDWTVTMEEGRRRLGQEMGVQGNLDPAILFAPHDVIKVRTTIEQGTPRGAGRAHEPCLCSSSRVHETHAACVCCVCAWI